MAYSGGRTTAIISMWILTALTFVHVLLRIYTRVWIVQSYGVDDHIYNLAFLLLLCYAIFVTISSHFGFGHSMVDITNPDDAARAMFFEAIGQTFAVVGMAVAKCALGMFLLRLVTTAWHKAAIWTTMSILMAASISVCFVFWLQCTPPSFLWDKRIKGGICDVNSTPVSMLLCILCVLVDFFFALFPWLFIWGLQMNRRDKLVILVSMSLGVIAAACGIKRTLEVPELSSIDYLDTVGLIVWSAAEIAVTMICIGIPICRPLYRRFLERLMPELSTRHDSNKLKQHNRQHCELRTFGCIDNRGHVNNILDLESVRLPQESKGYAEEHNNLDSTSSGIVNHTGTKSFVVSTGRPPSGEGSDDEILSSYKGQNEMNEHRGIRVTEEYRVTRSFRRIQR